MIGDRPRSTQLLDRLLPEPDGRSVADQPAVPHALWMRGVHAAQAGDHERALAYLAAALERASQQPGVDHPNLIQYRLEYARLLDEVGRYDAALVQVQKAVSALERGHGHKHPALARALLRRASIYHALGDVELARLDLERTRHVWQSEDMPADAKAGLVQMTQRLGQ